MIRSGQALKKASGPRCHISLQHFEGPLDLLLHLVRREEVPILEIPLALICARYLEFLDMMQSLDVDIASEYLVMASALAHLKSRSLLPQVEPDLESDEEAAPESDGAELLRLRLIELQFYQRAARILACRPILDQHVFCRGSEIYHEERMERNLAEIGIFELSRSLARVLKQKEKEAKYKIAEPRISIREQIRIIAARLEGGKILDFWHLVQLNNLACNAREGLIAALLAILEMARLGIIAISSRDKPGCFSLALRRPLTSLDAAGK